MLNPMVNGAIIGVPAFGSVLFIIIGGKMAKLTQKQLEVLIDIITTNRPWEGVQRGDGRRAKVIERLIEGGYIHSISYTGNLAWASQEGVNYVKRLLQSA